MPVVDHRLMMRFFTNVAPLVCESLRVGISAGYTYITRQRQCFYPPPIHTFRRVPYWACFAALFAVISFLFAPCAVEELTVRNVVCYEYNYSWLYEHVSRFITGYMLDPCAYNPKVLFILVLWNLSWQAIVATSCLLMKSCPVYASSWIDWAFPPETIFHATRGAPDANGEPSYTHYEARDFKDLLTADQFRLEEAPLSETNKHRYAARRRSAFNRMAEAFARRHGMEIHDGQQSARSIRKGISGTRTLMDAKDCSSYTAEQLRYTHVSDGNLRLHVDTITHKDLKDANHTLSDGGVHMIYTWNPTEVAGTSDELKFSFNENGEQQTEVDGSHDYSDINFDFESDCLITYSWEIKFNYSTLIGLIMIICLYYANITHNLKHNRTLWNCGDWGWYKVEHYPIYHPILYISHYKYHPQGFFAAIAHTIEWYGLSGSWFKLLDGMPYPVLDWGYFTYPWPEQAHPKVMDPSKHLIALGIFLQLLYFMYEEVAYAHRVKRIDVGEHRCVVMVVPNTKFKGCGVRLRPFMLKNALQQRKPFFFTTEGGQKCVAERIKSNWKGEAGYSAAFVGSHKSYWISDDLLSTARNLTTNKSLPSLANVRVTYNTEFEGDDIERLAVGLAVALVSIDYKPPAFSTSYEYGSVPHVVRQTTDELADGKRPKEIMAHTFQDPIAEGGAWVHTETEGTINDAVDRRIWEPAQKVADKFKLNLDTMQFIQEFAGLMYCEITGRERVPGTDGFLEPMDENEFEDSRNKTQHQKFMSVRDVYDIMDEMDREGFLKREVQQKAYKAGRLITTFTAQQQVLGGRIAGAYGRALKACSWNGCGRTPEEITASVNEVAGGAEYVTDTDFTAQDATIETNKRVVELYFLRCLFHSKYTMYLENWHWSDYSGKAIYGKKGTKRKSLPFEGRRGSGSPFTTYGNTPLTALFAYIALRLSGLSDVKAYKGLGVYSGDDGITANLPPEACQEAAELMGFLVKGGVNKLYVPYLGRIYFDPIGQSTSSIQDPARTLYRLHCTLIDNDRFTAEEAMIMKAMCFQVTDKHSDFFGDWSEKVLKEAGEKRQQSLKSKMLDYPGLHPYFAITALKTDSTFQNHRGDFIEYFDQVMPGFRWDIFKDWLENGKGPCPLLFTNPESHDKKLFEEMRKVGPVTLALRGPDDDAHKIEFSDMPAPDKKAPKGNLGQDGVDKPQEKPERKRTKKEQREFEKVAAKIGLIDEYRAAKGDASLGKAENRRRFTIRNNIELQVIQHQSEMAKDRQDQLTPPTSQ